MNICLLCYRGNPYCGGQGIYLYNLSKALVEQGHEVTVLVGPPYPDPMPWADVVRLPNMHYWGRQIEDIFTADSWKTNLLPLNFIEFVLSRTGYCPEILAFSFRAAARLKELHTARPFDVIHDAETLGFGLLIARAHEVPIVSTVHHPLRRDLEAFLPRAKNGRERFFNTIFYPLLMQGLVARRIDGMITSSKVGVEELQAAFRVKPQRINLVYTGVNTRSFSPDPSVKRAPNRLLFVGNAEDPRKGLTYLLDALFQLPPETRLTIVDTGEPHKFMAPRLIRSKGLEERVRFTGRLTEQELVHEYRMARVLIMPSLFEGFGLPVAEGMACGTPVVTTRAGSLPEVVGDDQEGGLLVPPKDSRALAEAISRIMSDPEFSEDLSRRARRRVERLFNWERTARNTVGVYQDLIESRTDRKAAVIYRKEHRDASPQR